MAVVIGCIRKEDRDNPYEHITHIGGKNPDGGRWLRTQEQAIKDIEGGTYSYVVKKEGHTVKVEVAVSRYGNKYIKTEADGDRPDNLLSLPECP